MKTLELLNKLQTLMTKHGNLDVKMLHQDEVFDTDISFVEIGYHFYDDEKKKPYILLFD